MPYEYLEHQADIGIRAWGRDYPEALAEVGPVAVPGEEGNWQATVTFRDETIDPARHDLGTEVKAATYSGLLLTEAPTRTTIQCLLDI